MPKGSLTINCCVAHFQPVDWPSIGPMTKPKVEEHCRLKIEGSVVGKLCGRLLDITFDMEIKGCMEDVKVRIAIRYTYRHTHHFMHAHGHAYANSTHTHAHAHAHAHANANAHTHARTHAHTHTHTQ